MAQNLGSVLPSLGASLGKGLAQPINQHLDLLAQDKLMQLQEAAQARQMQRQAAFQQQLAQAERNRLEQNLTGVFGPEGAKFIANLSPKAQEAFLGNTDISQLLNPQGQQQGGLAALQQPNPQGQPQVGMAALQQPAAEGQQVSPGATPNYTGTVPPKVGFEPMNQVPEGRVQVGKATVPTKPFQSPTIRLAENKFGFQQKEAEKAEKFREKQFDAKEKALAFKETKPERIQISDRARGARTNMARLTKMEQLNNKGNLNSPLYLEGLKTFGIDIDALKTPDTQEFNKLSIDFLSDANKVFGGRVTNYDAQTWLKRIPSLMQSKEGRQQVIQDLRVFEKAALIDEQAAKEVLKRNKGVPPLDFRERVDELAAPKVEKLYNQFHDSISAKSANDSQHKVIDAFDTLPLASEKKGKLILFPDGSIKRSVEQPDGSWKYVPYERK